MNYRSLFVVTYGRSGSTLLQSVLNGIDGVLLRGENMDFCWGLFCAYKALVTARSEWGSGKMQPGDSWYGADQLNAEQFLAAARPLVLEQLSPGPEHHCIGFKEIRYLDHLPDLLAYLNFLARLLPTPAFIFNTRDHAAVVDSAFWKRQDPKQLRHRLRQADDLFYAFSEVHDNSFIVRYENLIKGETALRPLFDFLGAAPDPAKLRRALDLPQGFAPKAETLRRAKRARLRSPSATASEGAGPDASEICRLDIASRNRQLDAAVWVVVPVRNERPLLPWVLEYYRRLGCEAFLFLDSGSSDGSVPYLREQERVILYHVDPEDFTRARTGRTLINSLVRRHALHRWVLCIDIDELLCWPDAEREGLVGLVRRAERLGLNRVFTPMIDAYAQQPTDLLPPYRPGTPFGEICSWIDPLGNTRFAWDQGRLVMFGGPRNRFVKAGQRPPITSKQSLYYVEERGYEHEGPHFDSYGVPSPLVAPLLHYKFMPDFSQRCDRYIDEGLLWNQAEDYRRYRDQRLGELCFWNEQSIQVKTGNDLAGYIREISVRIRKQGLAGSSHLTALKHVE